MKITRILVFVITLLVLNDSNAQGVKEKLSLMPWPKELKENNEKFFVKENFSISVNALNNRIKNGTTSFLRRLSGRTGVFIDQGFAKTKKENNSPSLEITFTKSANLSIDVDESYQLTVTYSKISIQAKTDIGVLRALETLFSCPVRVFAINHLNSGLSPSAKSGSLFQGSYRLVVEILCHCHKKTTKQFLHLMPPFAVGVARY